MQFDRSYPTIGQPNSCNTFQLSPTSSAELLAQPSSLPNGGTPGDCLYLAKLANNLKIHSMPLDMDPRENHRGPPRNGLTQSVKDNLSQAFGQ